jgi:hypothetical protein
MLRKRDKCAQFIFAHLDIQSGHARPDVEHFLGRLTTSSTPLLCCSVFNRIPCPKLPRLYLDS